MQQPASRKDGILVRGDGSMIFPAHVAKPTDLLFIVSRKEAHAPSLTLEAPDHTVITPTITMGGIISYTLTNVGGDFPYQEIYSISDAPAGDWQAVLDDLPAETGSVRADDYRRPAGATAGGRDRLRRQPDERRGRLEAAATAPVTLSLFANPGPITTTVVVTDTRSPHTEVLPDFTGYLLHTDPAPVIDGSPQSHEVSFSELPSGAYHIWAMADDGQSPPARVYAAESVTVTHPWPATWPAGLTAHPASVRSKWPGTRIPARRRPLPAQRECAPLHRHAADHGHRPAHDHAGQI